MKNKLTLFVSIVIMQFIVINSICAATAASSSLSCNPTIKILNQDPTPAVPDSYVKVVFEVTDMANCNGLTVKLEPEYPFSLDPGYESAQSIKGLYYSSSGYEATWDIPYKIRIASDALEGDYYLKLGYHEGEGNIGFAVREFNISIVDSQTDFAIVVQESSGTDVSLGVVNIGKNTANSLIVGVPQQTGYRASGTSQQIVGNLEAGDYTIVAFTLQQIMPRNSSGMMNSRNATRPGENIGASASEPLKIQLSYTDGIGKRRTVTKDVDYSSQGAGNFTAIGFRGQRNNTNANLFGLSYIWWLVIVGITLVIVLIIVYKKLGHKIFKKNDHLKSSEKFPDWVSAERSHNKK
jgi:hypothetical protein